MEGPQPIKPEKVGPTPIRPALIELPHTIACSVTGGYVYRGKQIPSLVGWYVFGEYVDGRVWGLKYEGGNLQAFALLIDPKDPSKTGGQRATQPASFGEAPDGELFLLDGNGPVYRIVGAE
jgi:hypothetical protein